CRNAPALNVGAGELPCPKCHAFGYAEDIFDHMFGRFGRQCRECGGSQKIECPLCDGRGTVYAYKGGTAPWPYRLQRKWDSSPKIRFALDPPLEEDGFEPSVPLWPCSA